MIGVDVWLIILFNYLRCSTKKCPMKISTVTDQHGCTDDLTVVINDSDAPVINLQSISSLTCHDSNDGSISVDVTLGTAPYKTTWDNGVADLIP